MSAADKEHDMPKVHDHHLDAHKRPPEHKAAVLPLSFWLAKVQGLERAAAETTLKHLKCPPPMMEQVLKVLQSHPKPTHAKPHALPHHADHGHAHHAAHHEAPHSSSHVEVNLDKAHKTHKH